MQIRITSLEMSEKYINMIKVPGESIIPLILCEKNAPMMGKINPQPNTIDYIWERIDCPLSGDIIFNIKERVKI